jgi:hypothetical protein
MSRGLLLNSSSNLVRKMKGTAISAEPCCGKMTSQPGPAQRLIQLSAPSTAPSERHCGVYRQGVLLHF